jgi:hypothetical protein
MSGDRTAEIERLRALVREALVGSSEFDLQDWNRRARAELEDHPAGYSQAYADKMRTGLLEIVAAGEIHDPHWAARVAARALLP